MKHRKFSSKVNAMLSFVSVVLLMANSWAASHQVLHSFTPNGTDAAFLYSGLIVDSAGNRYGTSYYGGTYNAGAVFELSSQQGGGWTEKLLYSFKNNGSDGINPHATLLLDTGGNLYGTTFNGGIHGGGAAFELSPQQGGSWSEKVLHSFGKDTDGRLLYAGLTMDPAGNLYGTTQAGGIHSYGTLFELSPGQRGSWTETVLHNFNYNGQGGAFPESKLIFDSAGNLYGTTQSSGIHYAGTAFELSPKQGGGWTETVLHSFGNGTDGAVPNAGMIFDTAGNLYGTTGVGGVHPCPSNGGNGCGTVFELSPSQGGGWTETVLHNFGNGTDGYTPFSGLVLDASGNLYGTTSSGGIHNFGTAFELAPKQGGGWTETVLHSFNLNGSDGTYPQAELLLDGAGNLYSTTFSGGPFSVGTVFELAPKQGGGFTESIVHSFDFNGTDGANPIFAGLIRDSAGNYYGTTSAGGAYDLGTVFELTPDGGEKVLYSFGHYTDAAVPEASLIFDGAGNLYGTTSQGGIHGLGAVFELSPSGGGWTERVLHSFGNNTDGYYPQAGLVFDSAGNLYGTTYFGGIHESGTAFQLMPNGSGGWTERVLHNFDVSNGDGAFPSSALIFDSAGNLYGTTYLGGLYFYGTVFELSPNGTGGWNETLLHSFNLTGNDGAFPQGSLIFDTANNLYGATAGGGIHADGSVFQLTPHVGGGWTEKVLHSFGGTDGNNPQAGLVMNGAGNLFGTTYMGGINNYGTVFELTPAGGAWDDTVLHNFNFDGSDGFYPESNLILDSGGNLYGTTSQGGTVNSGTVVEVTP